MSESNVVTEKSPVAVGRIEFGPEQRAEIDWRVSNKLAEREYIRQQYMRGFWDCLYIVAIVAWAVYLYWYWKDEN